MKEKQRFHIGIGVPSILMIFVVLCLTTFGVLSFSSASADYRLTEKNIAYMKAYYNADANAQEFLSGIDSILYQIKATQQADIDYYTKILETINSMDSDVTAFLTDNGEMRISYWVPVENEKYLNVVLSVLPLNQEKRYNIEEYCLTQKDKEGLEGGIIIEETVGAGLWQGGK